jgi:hypothetical protein
LQCDHDSKPPKRKVRNRRRARYVPIRMAWRIGPLGSLVLTPLIALFFNLWSDYGFYNIEAVALSVASLIYLIPYHCFSDKNTAQKSRLVVAGVVLTFIFTFASIWLITKPNNQYIVRQNEAVGNGTSPSVFLRDSLNATITQDQELRFEAEIYNFFTLYSTFAILGVFYGVLSVFTFYIGSRLKVDKKIRESYKDALKESSPFSFIIPIIGFVADNPSLLYIGKLVLGVISFILGAILFAQGLTIGPTKSWKEMISPSKALIAARFIVLGVLFGAALIPFTSAKYPFPPSPSTPTEYYYVGFPGIYFFAYSAMIFTAMFLYITNTRRSV